MHFAGLVKEYHLASVFPVPLNVLEHLINAVAPRSTWREGERRSWGRHYVSSTLLTRLKNATHELALASKTTAQADLAAQVLSPALSK
eukprot:COSAG05_NODE_858_length_6935_cov_2.188414_4_plen_88_part_00